ncbi:E3 ubiquitin-protein [Vigna angularis]|uniref:RING-type E3 ubiquitin transferase n=1 Tax=Phaseolus angularis TaxID=3914 RepID=A0A8T0LD75_PHAAN|nr:E3 ubiquitin-protein [Vigna angularis]
MSTFTNHHVGSTTSMNHQLRLPHLWHPSSVPHADNGIMSSIDVSQYKEGGQAQNFLSYMLMNTDDMSYETLYNVQEFPSLGDPHSDMRLDIDGMSYEASILYIEWMNDNSEKGLSEDIIARHMQTKSYLLSENLGDQESDICIICQDEYKNKEEIGILQCGHEYHGECIKRWLHEKNVCPMCKSKGLTIE